MTVLSYTPGQKATIILETFGTDGYRMDCPDLPIVANIFGPDFMPIDGYGGNMTQISTGLYGFYYTIPTGAAAVGSYILDVTYIDPITLGNKELIYQLLVNAPYGIYSAV